MRGLESARGGDGRRDHLDRLVVGRDQDGDPVPGSVCVTGSGPGQSMFHSVTIRIRMPMSGTASKQPADQAAARFQPPSGSVKTMRQVR